MKGAKGKKPSKEVYFKDILSDRQLQATRASTRGIWLNILCYFWEEGSTGEIFGFELEELSRLGGATIEEAGHFIKDAQKHKFCDIKIEIVRERPFIVRLANRRIVNEAKQRKQWAKEKRKQRGQLYVQEPSGEVPPDVHPSRARPSPSPSPTILKDSNKRTAPLSPQKSNHYEEKVGEFFNSIYVSCETISKYPQKPGRPFNPHQWVQEKCNNKYHPGAIDEVMAALAKKTTWDGIENHPYGYGNSILKTKAQNWNEKEAVAIHEAMKKWDPKEFADLTRNILKVM